VALALLRLPAASAVPAWAESACHFLSVTRTPTELSIVADAASLPAELGVERLYRAFRVQGPLPHHLVGIMASLAVPLAHAAVPIVAIATYDTDYVLVQESDLSRARDALAAAGHQIAEPDAPGGGS
jgi:hypothetical protein